MKPFLKLEGFVSGDILVNAPQVLIQRVKSSDPIIEEQLGTNQFLAKTAAAFDIREAKRIEYEVQIITRIYEVLEISLPAGEGRARYVPLMNDIAEAIDEIESSSYYASLRIPNIVKVEKQHDIPVLLFRDLGMIPLRQYLKTDDSLQTIVKIMVLASEGLAAIHSAQIAHLNLNLDCFFVKNGDDEHSSMMLQLFDFRNSLYVGELGTSFHFNPESNASYISPEQSGRMSKKIDTRSDIYSLGILFWELLVKSHPFEGADKENMIYYHIAKKIPEANTVNRKIPTVLSNIVSKMVCKDRSERYQNITALKFDLLEILPDQSVDGEVMDDDAFCNHLLEFQNFRIASKDKSNLLVLKEEVIQRPLEIKILQNIFSRDTTNYPLSVVCLKGKEGTGRRSLVNQLSEHVQSLGGILIDCTITDQAQNHFTVLIDRISRTVLSRTTEQLLATRNSLLQRVGREDLGILIHKISSIKAIMGANFKTPLIENFDQAIFENSLKKFLEVILGTVSSVLYFSNIIGCEEALDLLKSIIQEKKLKAMIIVNYENKLPGTSNDFFSFCDTLLQNSSHILEVRNLTVDEIELFLGSLLVPTKGNLNALAHLLFNKSGGSAFHLKELVSFCATNNLFYFDEDLYLWQWNIENLKIKLKITENVADSLIENINLLSKELMNILTACSIMGNQFELLQIERTLQDINFDSNIGKLVEMQYLLPLPISSAKKKRTSSFTNRPTLYQKCTMYEMTSPRTRLAVLDGLTMQQKGVYCSNLVLAAKELGLSLAKYQYDDFLVTCNENINEIRDPVVLVTLFQINLTLARYSIRTGNIKDGLSDFAHANTIMEKNREILWKDIPEETFEMRAEYARLLLQYNAAALESIQDIIEELESKESDNRKQLLVIVLKLRILEFRSDYESMASLGKKTLSEFSIISFDSENNSNELYMEKLSQMTTDTPQEVFKNNGVVEFDGDSKYLREVLFLTCIALEVIKPGPEVIGFLTQACCFELENGCSVYSCMFFSALLKHFIQPGRPFNYSMFRWIAEFSMLLIDAGEKEAKNAATLAAMKGMDLIWPSSKTMSCAKDYLESNFYSASFDAIQTVEIVYLYSLSIGTRLSDISLIVKSFSAKAKDSPMFHFFTGSAATDCLHSLGNEAYPYNHQFRVLPQYLALMKVLIYGEIEEKVGLLTRIPKLLDEVYTMTAVIDILLIKYLFLADILRDGPDDDLISSYESEIAGTSKLLQKYFEVTTMKELRCKFLLVNAEECRRIGNTVDAIVLYEECIEQAILSKNIFIQALANECYGTMLADIQSKILAKPCLVEAIETWIDFGCEEKAQLLKSKFSYILSPHAALTRGPTKKRNSLWENVIRNTNIVTNAIAKKEDKTAIIEFSSSLSQEKNLEVLLTKMANYLITTAAATKCAIMLAEQDILNIHAISYLDDSGKILNDATVYNAESECKVPLKPTFYVWRSGEKMILNDSSNWDASFKADEYLQQYRPKSFLCLPIIYQEGITGVVYLENAVQKRSFTTGLVELVQSFFTSASVAIENARLQRKNQELENELESKNNTTPKLSFDSPIQKVLEYLQNLKAKFEFDPAELENVDLMMQILNSDDLFKADLNFDNDLDSETKMWVESTLMQHDVSGNNNISNAIMADNSIRSTNEPENVAKSYLEMSDPMEFDIFKFTDLSNQQPLYYLTMFMFHEFRIFETLKINQEKASKYFQTVEANYNQLPYHNSIHAADLLKTVRSILFDTPLCSKFTESEIACLIIGGAIHDVDHPGVNNNFLNQLSHPLSVLYNDASVLENHHSAFGFELARDPECNIFQDLDPTMFSLMRKLIIQSVLATDLAMHFQILNKFKAKFSGGNLKLEESSDRAIVMEMAMKCGDLANPTRPTNQSVAWSFRIMQEFFNQGEREKMLGLPVSQFMDEANTNIPKCQIGFIDFLVAPLYDVWTLFSSTPYTEACIKNISLNRNLWKEWQENPSLMPAFPSKAARKDEVLDMKTMTIVKFGSGDKSHSSNHGTYWTMIPIGNNQGKLPSRTYGTGIAMSRVPDYNPSRRRSSISAPAPEIDLNFRPSFRNVVQALMANKGKGTEKSKDNRPRSSTDSKRANDLGKRGSIADRRVSVAGEFSSQKSLNRQSQKSLHQESQKSLHQQG